MKCLFVIFLAFFTYQASGQWLELFNDVTKLVLSDHSFAPYLNKIRPIFRTGNETLKIPMIDPSNVDFQKINISSEAFIADGNLTNVEVYGLSNYTVNSATYNAVTLLVKSNVTWPSVVVNSSYILDGKIFQPFNLSLYGDGQFTLEIYNLTLYQEAKLELKDGKVVVDTLKTNATFDSNWFYASGIYNSDFYSVVMSDVITSWLPYVVENYPRVVIDPFDEKFKEAVNEHYKNSTLDDLILVIGSS